MPDAGEGVERVLCVVPLGHSYGLTAGLNVPVAIGAAIILEAEMPTHLMLLGGEPLSEPRFTEWNFVSSSLERIAQAKADWKAGLFDKVAGDEIEFIPLPE